MQTDHSKLKRYELSEALTTLALSVKNGGSAEYINGELCKLAIAADEIGAAENERDPADDPRDAEDREGGKYY